MIAGKTLNITRRPFSIDVVSIGLVIMLSGKMKV